MTTIMEDLIARGIIKGKIKGKQECILLLLKERFNLDTDVFNDIESKLINITDLDILRGLFKEAIRCVDIESFMKKVDKNKE